ncbi:MAG: hypothetical protein AAB405_02020 [Patescibacteria group bacterium]
MKNIILGLFLVLIFATVAVAEITGPMPCPGQEQHAVKVVRGPAGPRGSQGARGPIGPAGPQGEIPWWPLALVAIGGGLLGGVIVAALNRPQQPPPAQPVPQPVQPVNIFNNVLPPVAGQQPPQQSNQPQ